MLWHSCRYWYRQQSRGWLAAVRWTEVWRQLRELCSGAFPDLPLDAVLADLCTTLLRSEAQSTSGTASTHIVESACMLLPLLWSATFSDTFLHQCGTLHLAIHVAA